MAEENVEQSAEGVKTRGQRWAEKLIVASKGEDGIIGFLRPGGRDGDDPFFQQYFNKDAGALDRIREWASLAIDAACDAAISAKDVEIAKPKAVQP
jgi:hypothetical protein